jgi:hypothetical protein
MSIAMGIILLSIAFLLHTLLARFRGDFYDWDKRLESENEIIRIYLWRL